MITSKWILEKWIMMVWNGSNWLRVGSNSRLMRTQWLSHITMQPFVGHD